MIALVGDQLGAAIAGRGAASRVQAPGCRLQRVVEGGRVAAIGGVDRGRDDRLGVQIDRVLGLVGQARAAVLHAGDLRLGVGRARPLGIAQPLALALAIELLQLGRARRRHAALLGHPGQHRAVALAAVAPADRAHRRVGLHGRRVDADALALDQSALGELLQHPGEHPLMHLERQPGAAPAQPGMVGHPIAQPEPEEVAQRQAVGAAPLQAALAVDALEVADQMHAEIAPGRQRRRAHDGGVVRLAERLDEGVEPGLDQHLLQPVVEHVPRRLRQLVPGHQHLTLPWPLPPHRHGWHSPSLLLPTANLTPARLRQRAATGRPGPSEALRRLASSGKPAHHRRSGVRQIWETSNYGEFSGCRAENPEGSITCRKLVGWLTAEFRKRVIAHWSSLSAESMPLQRRTAGVSTSRVHAASRQHSFGDAMIKSDKSEVSHDNQSRGWVQREPELTGCRHGSGERGTCRGWDRCV